MDIFLLYLWTRLDTFSALSTAVMGFGFFATALATAIWLAEDLPLAKTVSIASAKVCIGAGIIFLIIPSEKDVAIIAGGWAVKQVATSEGAQQLSSKTFALINGKLDEELAKLKKETK